MAHPQEGNVTWVNFAQRKKVTSAEEARSEQAEAGAETVEVPFKRTARSLRLNPAAEIILQAAQRGADQGRYGRGRKYADEGNVIEVRTEIGRFTGSVAGSQNEPFTTMILLPYRDADAIQQALELMAHNANALKAARTGRFHKELLNALVAGDGEKIRFRCDCPDNYDVCKHGVAVAIKAAELIDADPTLIFRLRNLDLNTLEQQLRATAGERAKQSAAEGSEQFWTGHELPDLPQPKTAPMIEDSDLDLLHKAMQTISFTNIDQLRAVSDLEDLYDELTRR